MLAEALRLLRVFHKVPQIELSEKLGISRSYLSEIESGKKKISLDLLEGYGRVFEVPVSSLLLFSEQMSKNSFSEKTRIFAAQKVLNIFKWIEDGGSDTQHVAR
ncbi:helix-turn-helix domain-containing protein [Nitratidesulfovibrio termitidis]|uniref:helix-turn-helix domain-containing protein n=1 Tax=Nitratidesulfovibrio termitidis TaxID=42252 RepID=UPI0009FBAE5C|nr:helix-turn-helix transcriptional regulator [Nitratidesulfovibrio termitidis]